MARDINIRPDIRGLDEAFQTELQAARTQPGTLDSVLGLGLGLPLKLAQARKAEGKKKALGQFARTGKLSEDFEPENAAEVATLAQAGKAMRAGEDEQIGEDLSRALLLNLGDIATPIPPGGFTRKNAGVLIAGKQAQTRAAGGGVQNGSVPGVRANKALGVDYFDPEAIVTPQELMTARVTVGREEGQLTEKSATTVANMRSGIAAIGEMREILSGPGGQMARFKAALPIGSSVVSIGDPQAQRLKKAAAEAIDVLTRARTGAALNEEEQRTYGNLLLGLLDGPEAVNAVMDRYQNLFEETQRLVVSGKRQTKFQALKEIENELRGGGRAPAAQTPRSGVNQDPERARLEALRQKFRR